MAGNLSFKRVLDYEKHINSKRHADNVLRTSPPEVIWNDFEAGAKHWSIGCTAADVMKRWDYDELSSLGLKYRKTCLHPTPVIGSLQPFQRARIWRYLRDVLGLSYYTEIATVMAQADSDEQGHLRVKEVFESFEAFKIISSFVIATRKSATSQPLKSIVELACGHGLVGVLLAYRFPDLEVHLFDIHKRPTYEAFIRAFEKVS